MPRELGFVPFRGSQAVRNGAVTKGNLRGPSWVRLYPDIYVAKDAYQPENHRMWCDGAALTLTEGCAIDGHSAAFLWSVDLLPRNAPVSVSVPPSVRVWPHPRRKVARAVLSPNDISEFAGLPLTTPLRTAFDLGRRLPRVEAIIALDALCHRRLVTPRELAAYAGRREGFRGVARLRKHLLELEPLSESPMETRLRLLLRDGGCPPPRAQVEVRTKQGHLIARVDLAYPQWRIALEYDGDHHRARAQFRRDVERLNALRAAGWIVLRFTADDVLRHPERVLRHVAQAIKERA